jgi:hypothetical protein
MSLQTVTITQLAHGITYLQISEIKTTSFESDTRGKDTSCDRPRLLDAHNQLEPESA